MGINPSPSDLNSRRILDLYFFIENKSIPYFIIRRIQVLRLQNRYSDANVLKDEWKC